MMNHQETEILFAEDSIDDAALTMRALKKGGLSNFIFHVKDGAEALDFLFSKGDYENQPIPSH
jgi:two-component system response regulator